jgi:transketolase C-terminal domain/subunit
VQEILSELHPVKVKKLGLPHGYTTSGPYGELLRHYGLGADGIADSIESFLSFPSL